MLRNQLEPRLDSEGARRDAASIVGEVSAQMDMPFVQPVSVPAVPTPVHVSPRRFAALVDRVGATASLLCAVHCMLLPFVLALLPLIGLAFLAGHTFERIFVACAAALASASILVAYRRHRHPHALFLMVPGIVLLVLGVAIDINAHVVIHTTSVVTGGLLVASAHVTNLVLAHRHRHATCTQTSVWVSRGNP
ncbi:MAG TPA: MerC domain-containing protein [Rhodanobacteraceae bacterium]|nr:MerC domain-containing protein [Rhodanobacteraceae bacterium]